MRWAKLSIGRDRSCLIQITRAGFQIIIAEFKASANYLFERRDRTTHWSYIVLTAVVTAYIGFFADGNFVTPLGRFGLVSGVLLVLIRFFFQSMIAYGYFLKWRYFRTKIEEHWMNGTPSIDEIKQDIVNFDHNKAMPETGRNLFMGQVKSGFILILAIPITLLAIELHLTQTWEYFMILISVGSYFVFRVL